MDSKEGKLRLEEEEYQERGSWKSERSWKRMEELEKGRQKGRGGEEEGDKLNMRGICKSGKYQK